MPNADSTQSHCNICLGHKNHKVVHVETTSWKDTIDEYAGYSIDGGDRWTLLRCLGCDAVRLKHESWCSEDSDDVGRVKINTEWFPPTVRRQKPAWRRELRFMFGPLNSYGDLSDEIYEALAMGANRLATMGVRALVERLMVDNVGDKGTFEKTISAFFSAGHVAPNQQAMFRETLIEAGHAAMHRGFEPSADTVNTLLDIVEGIMHQIYVAPVLAQQVNKTIPKRN